MPKDALESGHQIHLTREQAAAYLKKRMAQVVNGQRSQASMRLAEFAYRRTYRTGEGQLPSLEQLRRFITPSK